MKVLLGASGTLRLRVRTWRVIFERGGEGAVVILDIRPRGSAYKP